MLSRGESSAVYGSAHSGRGHGWRKTVQGLSEYSRSRGKNAVRGRSLYAGDLVDVPIGTLVIAVDNRERPPDRHREEWDNDDATVTVSLVGREGLEQVWDTYYSQAKSALAATTRKKLTSLLREYPTPAGDVVVIAMARVPNRIAGSCRWCGGYVPSGTGHDRHSVLEHYGKCPARPAANGASCARCGTVAGSNGMGLRSVMIREDGGFWETIHADNPECAQRSPARRENRELPEPLVLSASVEAGSEHNKMAVRDRVHRVEERIDDAASGTRRIALFRFIDTLSDDSTVKGYGVCNYPSGFTASGEFDYDPKPSILTEHTNLKEARAIFRGYR